jgi:hypothetical protein
VCRGFKSLLRYHVSPTTGGLGEGVPADQRGKFALYLNLEPFAWAVRMDGHVVNEGTEAPDQGSSVVPCLRMVGKARGQRVDRRSILVKRRRMQGDDFRSLFKRSDIGFDLQALRLKTRDPLARIVLFNHSLYDHVDVSLPLALDPSEFRL